MLKFLSGDVNPFKYGGKWYDHEKGDDHVYVIEIIPHEWYGIDSDKGHTHTGILSCVCVDDEDLEKAYSCTSYYGWDEDYKKLKLEQKIEVLHSYHGGDHILSLTGKNPRLIKKTLEDVIYTEPYAKIPDSLDARWY